MNDERREQKKEWRRMRAWRERYFPNWRVWRDLGLSDDQHGELISARLQGQQIEVMELVAMSRFGCTLAEARAQVATLTEVPCPGRHACTGGHVHASQVLEETLAQRATMRLAARSSRARA